MDNASRGEIVEFQILCDGEGMEDVMGKDVVFVLAGNDIDAPVPLAPKGDSLREFLIRRYQHSPCASSRRLPSSSMSRQIRDGACGHCLATSKVVSPLRTSTPNAPAL